MEEPLQQPEIQAPESNKPDKKLLLIGGGMLFLLIILGGIFLYGYQYNKFSPKPIINEGELLTKKLIINEGELLTNDSRDKFFIIQNGEKRKIDPPEALHLLEGYNFQSPLYVAKNIKIITDEDLETLPTGDSIFFPEGTFIGIKRPWYVDYLFVVSENPYDENKPSLSYVSYPERDWEYESDKVVWFDQERLGELPNSLSSYVLINPEVSFESVNTNGWKEYYDEHFKLRLRHPDNWNVTSSDSDFYGHTIFLSPYAEEGFNLGFGYLDTHTLRRANIDRVVNLMPLQVDGMAAIELLTEHYSGSSLVEAVFIEFQKDDTEFSFEFMYVIDLENERNRPQAEEARSLRRTFRTIIRTMEFLE